MGMLKMNFWAIVKEHYNLKRLAVLCPTFALIAILLGVWSESSIVSFILGIIAGVSSVTLSMK
jgi:uncharacterized membrane protein (GlpM family)